MNKCKTKGCDPVEQVRSQLKHEDYFDVLENDTMERFVDRITYKHGRHGGEYNPELTNENASDVRIICKKCHKTTGWGKADAPGMPGVGLDFMRRRWDELKDLSFEEIEERRKASAIRPKMVQFSDVVTKTL